jgi:hypothetical protein
VFLVRHAKTSASSPHSPVRRAGLRRHAEEDRAFRRGQLLAALTDALVRLLMKQRMAQLEAAPPRESGPDVEVLGTNS